MVSLIATSLLLLQLSGLQARAQDWLVSSAAGPVFKMENDAWVEVFDHEPLRIGVAVRTLRGARAELSSGAIRIRLEPGSAVRVEANQGGGAIIRQFSGSISVSISQQGTRAVVVQTPAFTIKAEATSADFRSDLATGQVWVDRGEVVVVDNVTGKATEVGAGVATSTADPTATGTVTSAFNGRPDGDSSAGDSPDLADKGRGTGNGNAWGKGNGGKENGNAGGNGNGNTGGKGNGNGNGDGK